MCGILKYDNRNQSIPLYCLLEKTIKNLGYDNWAYKYFKFENFHFNSISQMLFSLTQMDWPIKLRDHLPASIDQSCIN